MTNYNILNAGSREILNLDGPIGSKEEAESFAAQVERENDIDCEVVAVDEPEATISLYLVNGTRCYAKVNGELLAIGGLNEDGTIYRGDHLHSNADLKKLDEYCGAAEWNYDHALATARDLLSQASSTATRVSSVAEIN